MHLITVDIIYHVHHCGILNPLILLMVPKFGSPVGIETLCILCMGYLDALPYQLVCRILFINNLKCTPLKANTHLEAEHHRKEVGNLKSNQTMTRLRTRTRDLPSISSIIWGSFEYQDFFWIMQDKKTPKHHHLSVFFVLVCLPHIHWLTYTYVILRVHMDGEEWFESTPL